jgi:hypothetical protein
MLVLAGIAILAACDPDGGASELSGSGGAGGSGAGDFGGSFGGFNAVGGSSSGGGEPEITEVFGHGPSTLYRLEPITKQVTAVGQFSGCSGGVIDIAIDKDNQLYGTTSTGLYRINRETAVCTEIATGNYPNSLSFVPEGTLDPDVEALVGYVGSDYVRIDPVSGTVQPVGSIGSGLASSGDIVSVEGGGTYLTVTGAAAGCGDCIVEVNPKTGDLVQNFGSVDHAAVYGLAFWGGSAYGFSNGGQLFEIAFDGGSVSTQLISIPGAPAGLAFWGAGSSTAVPLVAPQ